MREVITADGRALAVEQWGPPDGTPVLYLHGSPMSRLARYPDDALFHRLGIRLFTYDRPGYGNSTRNQVGASSTPPMMWRRSPMS